jgi:hypothetical protein
VNHKIISAVIYAITVLAIANYFDCLSGAEPIPHSPRSTWVLIYAAAAGVILFTTACVLSIFRPRLGIICGLAASILSWPFFARELWLILRLWHTLFSVIGYYYWDARLASVLMLIASSLYSLSQLRLLFRTPVAR